MELNLVLTPGSEGMKGATLKQSLQKRLPSSSLENPANPEAKKEQQTRNRMPLEKMV